MKKFFKMVAVALCIAATTSSCGTMLLNNSNSGTNLTNVELSNANYRIVKNVEGFASASYVFGIGGLSRKATRDNAVADMMRNANLTRSQAVVNVHIKSHFAAVLCFYMRYSCSATAQVIEFLPETGAQKTRYSIGDTYDDGTKQGIVFEVSEGGLHGKIVYPKILDWTKWSTKDKQENMPKTTDAEDGEKNMQIILNIPDWQNKYPAFAACAKLGADWYLPAKNELIKLCKVFDGEDTPDVTATDAWSSTIYEGENIETLQWQKVNSKHKAPVVAVAKF